MHIDRGGRAERHSASVRALRTPPTPRGLNRLRLKWQRNGTNGAAKILAFNVRQV